MLAVVYHGSGDLRVETRDDPELEPGGALLEVEACGICGTDLRIAAGRHRAYKDGAGEGRVPGHEIAGRIAEVGPDAAGLEVGDRVFVAPNLGCGHCPACRAGRYNLCPQPQAFGITRDGAFAQYLDVPARGVRQGNLLRVPEHVDPAALSVVEPLACVLRGQRATSTGEGDLVVVGGAGPVGLLHLMVARHLGARVLVSEPSAHRREQAKAFGADDVIDPLAEDLLERVREASDGRGADVVITAAPVAALQEQALELAAIGGRINFFGALGAGDSVIRIDSNVVHYRELVVTGTNANDTDDCRRALGLVADGAVDTARLVSARFALSEAAGAFAAARGGEMLKVVVEP